MSLDATEEKNTQSDVRPISGSFSDKDSFGVNKKGELVRVADTSTWAGVFENGLNVEDQYRREARNNEIESVIWTPPQHNIQPVSNYDCFKKYEDIETRYYDKKQYEPRGELPTTHTASNKQREKTARSRKRKVAKLSKMLLHQGYDFICGPDQITCECYQCEDNREYIDESTCDCCGEEKDVNHYNSIYSKEGTEMCNKCAMYECCRGCGWDSGGSLCICCRFW
tara:strand:- start:33 stop:707 length:675 start_codon:yes stop_codon:yes gene_type:complete